MGRIILGLMGIALSFLIFRFRRMIGDTIGEGVWMQKIGGVYTVVIYAGIFIFFWSLLMIFNLTNIFIAPFIAPFRAFGL